MICWAFAGHTCLAGRAGAAVGAFRCGCSGALPPAARLARFAGGSRSLDALSEDSRCSTGGGSALTCGVAGTAWGAETADVGAAVTTLTQGALPAAGIALRALESLGASASAVLRSGRPLRRRICTFRGHCERKLPASDEVPGYCCRCRSKLPLLVIITHKSFPGVDDAEWPAGSCMKRGAFAAPHSAP